VTLNVASAAQGSDVRPVLRGVLHGIAFLASLVVDVIFVAETTGLQLDFSSNDSLNWSLRGG